MRIASSLSIVLALSASVVACSALSEDSDSQDDSLRINPTGSENMSTLIVQLPTGACLPGGSCAHPLSVNPTITLDATNMTIGQPLRVAPGEHRLGASGTGTKLNLVAGATRTLILPVVKKACTNASGSTLADTQFGRQPTLRNAACPNPTTVDGNTLYNPALDSSPLDLYAGANCTSTYLFQQTRNYACSGLSSGSYQVRSLRFQGACLNVPARDWRQFCDTYVASGASTLGVPGTVVPLTGDTAVVPGTYAFPVENASGTGTTNESRAVAESDVKTLSFTLPLIGTVPDRFNTNLKFNDAREMADADPATITSNCNERNFTVPNTATGTLALKAFKFSECNYVFKTAGRTVNLNQAADNNISLSRIDLNDIEVTREDGTKYFTPGTYEIYFGGNLVAGPYNTKTGVDVLPGAYEVVVKYNTAEGPKVNHYNVSF